MRYGYTVENSPKLKRIQRRNMIKFRMKQKKKFGFKIHEAAYDNQIGITK